MFLHGRRPALVGQSTYEGTEKEKSTESALLWLHAASAKWPDDNAIFFAASMLQRRNSFAHCREERNVLGFHSSIMDAGFGSRCDEQPSYIIKRLRTGNTNWAYDSHCLIVQAQIARLSPCGCREWEEMFQIACIMAWVVYLAHYICVNYNKI